MHVKTYTGASTSAVLATIKSELGPEAVILDTRQTEENGKKKVLITAAVERQEAGAGAPMSGAAGFGAGGRSAKAAASAYSANDFSGTAYASATGTGWKTWQEEWSFIKQHLLGMMKPELQFSKLTPRQRVALEFLEREGVDHTSLLTVYDELAPDPQASILAPLCSLLPVRPWDAGAWPQRIHMVGGPFGTGKTTVLVRMALLLRQQNPDFTMWVVNCDAERGGGRLLLKNYAHLCGLEYKEAANAVAFATIQAEARVKGVQRIFVDLPGLARGQTMPHLLEYLGMTDPANALHLVMPPLYGESEMRAMFGRYAPGRTAENTGIVWTKLDEAEKFGTLVNVGATSRLPVSALSCGPELSDTLFGADHAMIWRLLFKREMPSPVSAG